MQIRVRNSGAVMYQDEFHRLHEGLGLPKVLTEAIINEWGGERRLQLMVDHLLESSP